MKDKTIEQLIRPPRKIFEGFDWKRSDRLKPNGDASKDKALAARLDRKREAYNEA